MSRSRETAQVQNIVCKVPVGHVVLWVGVILLVIVVVVVNAVVIAVAKLFDGWV